MINKENYTVEILFPERQIQKRIFAISSQISKDYENKDLVVVAVLNGSFIFCADLVRNLDVRCAIDFIRVSSYSGGQSSGRVKVISDFKEESRGKDVLIVEDIADSGVTLDFLIGKISANKPKSIKTCVFLDKKCARQKDVPIDYSCFEIGNDFIVGYGLDYSGFFRQLPYVGRIKEFNK
ncbi:MAG: hypoxanthine phosphoribosyltransferase [Endomicrobium sp.]|jgi:hypoxanthine phosphoribosyltransferase|uniref:hypoxanthine phosphoribosyltransferase n=1 Tax=Candidatus Endomicrobiellum cubanum TaxID=3242325 RepID=UPI00282FD57B|nr:hypoxanthine phosphoribosyltransferase [Endomicrobium sp.]MDR2395973.1 hypoxanthine phosphoribosyltransferase [Endomicrobium sp.]